MAVKPEGNFTLTFNSNALTNYVNSLDFGASTGQLETTDFGSTGKEYVNDTPEWDGSAGGHWDPTLDGYLAPDILTPVKRTVAIVGTDSDSDSITYTWTTNAGLTEYTVSSDVGGFISWTSSLAFSGAPSRS